MEELGEEANFWRKEISPPQSPNLNPLDYSIWSVLQESVQGTPNMESLKAHIAEAWDTPDEAFIASACCFSGADWKPISVPMALHRVRLRRKPMTTVFIKCKI